MDAPLNVLPCPRLPHPHCPKPHPPWRTTGRAALTARLDAGAKAHTHRGGSGGDCVQVGTDPGSRDRPTTMHSMGVHIQPLTGHGVVTRTQLLASGLTRATLQSLIETGDVVRLDRSRFAMPGTEPHITTAVAAGGTLTCVSALRHHGARILAADAIHVRRPIRRRRGRNLEESVVECAAPSGMPDHPLDGVDAALGIALTNHSDEDAMVILDSILNLRIRSRSELHVALQGHSMRATRLFARADAGSESVLESVVRHRLRTRGIGVRTQAPIPGLGRVDMLVGKSLLVETDGYEFHADRESFREDRRRDRRAAALGYSVVRLTWEQTFSGWPQVLADISAIIATRRHLRQPRTPPTGSKRPMRQ